MFVSVRPAVQPVVLAALPAPGLAVLVPVLSVLAPAVLLVSVLAPAVLLVSVLVLSVLAPAVSVVLQAEALDLVQPVLPGRLLW